VLSWVGLERGTYARVLIAEARASAALAAYDLTVLRALEETENAFVTYGTHRQRLKSVVEQATASRTAAELARIQYREGALDFLRVLDAERTLLQAEDEVAAAETNLNSSVVLIYKALGGGWEAAPAVALYRRAVCLRLLLATDRRALMRVLGIAYQPGPVLSPAAKTSANRRASRPRATERQPMRRPIPSGARS
jgi:hypothetical protein